MRFSSIVKTPGRRWLALGGVALIVGTNGCGLDEVQVPALIGPSEAGLSLDLKANPDTISADGVSQSVVRITARDQNGAPAPNRQLSVQLKRGDGFLVAGSVLVGPLQTAVSLLTDSNGIAQVVYTAGTSPGQLATIGVRPYSFDATADPDARERTVTILQQ
jgi:Invasin, domain 3